MRSSIISACLALTLVLTPGEATAPRPADGVTITYLANEGVLLSGAGAGGTRHVLIDALFESYAGYPVPAESTTLALRRARTPFAAVDLVLATHRHGDHFHPAPVAEHLAANPRAILVAPRQVVDSLRGRASADILRRVAGRTQRPGTRRPMLVNGVPVELLGVPHAGRRHPQVEHLAFAVELGGRRVLHLGDAELSEETLAPFRLDTMRIDVALIPYWVLQDDETRRVIERWIRPVRMAAFHISDSDSVRTRRELAGSAPGIHVFTRRLERVSW